jgi:hypothetical protein
MSMTLHPGQSQIFSDLFVEKTVQNAVGVCTRGFGKSHLGAVAGIAAANELCQLPAHVPNKSIFIIAPTYAQVTDIYYPLLVYQLGQEKYLVSHSKDTGRLVYPRGVELRLVSYEAIDRLRGLGAYLVVMDEVRDWTSGGGFQDAWESVLQPCISTRWSPKQAAAVGAPSPGRSLTLSTPKGYDYLYTHSRKQEKDDSYRTYQFDYTKAPLLDQDEVLKIKQTIDPIKFAREYLASFKDSGANIFYCFDRDIHVRKDLPYFRRGSHEAKGEDVHIGVDFNVMMQASSAFAVRTKEIHYLDEFKGSPDTDTLAVSIKAKYWPNYNNQGHPEYQRKICNIYIYPDATGSARKTSAPVGVTDHNILRSHGFEVRTPNVNPSIIDSVNCVNRLLKTADGQHYMFVSATCEGLIISLERTSWVDKNPDTATIDKSKGEEHFSDGVRYPMSYLFPIQSGQAPVKRGFGF